LPVAILINFQNFELMVQVPPNQTRNQNQNQPKTRTGQHWLIIKNLWTVTDVLKVAKQMPIFKTINQLQTSSRRTQDRGWNQITHHLYYIHIYHIIFIHEFYTDILFHNFRMNSIKISWYCKFVMKDSSMVQSHLYANMFFFVVDMWWKTIHCFNK